VTAALSPAVSWMLMGAVLAVAVVIYVAIVGRDFSERADDELDRMDEQWLERWRRDHPEVR
jgi:hypothetical protein